jgi:hypothetical protein
MLVIGVLRLLDELVSFLFADFSLLLMHTSPFSELFFSLLARCFIRVPLSEKKLAADRLDLLRGFYGVMWDIMMHILSFDSGRLIPTLMRLCLVNNLATTCECVWFFVLTHVGDGNIFPSFPSSMASWSSPPFCGQRCCCTEDLIVTRESSQLGVLSQAPWCSCITCSLQPEFLHMCYICCKQVSLFWGERERYTVRVISRLACCT